MVSFTERKLIWLEAVASDPNMQRLAVVVAVKLATRYLNSNTGEAWPGIDRLARELTANPRNVRRAIASLVESGWLDKRRGGHGRGDSNHYRIKMEGAHAPLTERIRGAHTTDKGGARRQERGAHTPPEPGNEPERNPGGSHPASRSSFSRPGRSQTSHARSNEGAPFPQKWGFGSAEAKIALASPARWLHLRAQAEFEKFTTYHVKKGDRWSDWPAAWESWCRKGINFSSNHARRDKVVELVAGVSGPNGWYSRQKTAHQCRERPEEE
ncbi:helix-turn-helix domain-containing protein [Bradyrhizobium sp. 197]|nr:helix-turn-helix domain-containing protein [Bradyrhizobium sp. 197]